MTSKHKKKLNNYPRFLVIIGIVILFIGINLLAKNQFKFQSIFSKIKPSATPIPTLPADILPAKGLNTDKEIYIKLAIEMLVKRLKADKEKIKIISAKEKNWSDSSLGCPEKGKIYIQAITSGYIIELSYKGTKYIYHGGLNRVVSCKSS